MVSQRLHLRPFLRHFFQSLPCIHRIVNSRPFTMSAIARISVARRRGNLKPLGDGRPSLKFMTIWLSSSGCGCFTMVSQCSPFWIGAKSLLAFTASPLFSADAPVGVFHCEFVARLTRCSTFRHRGRAEAPHHVRIVAYGFEMVGVHTVAYTAEMVDGQTFGYRTNKELIRPAMSRHTFARSIPEAAVAFG